MKSLLVKIAVRKVVGLYLANHEVAVCKLASTPLGPVVVDSATEPCTSENMAEVVERLLVPLLGRKRRAAVAVGVAASRVFFGTRLTPTSGDIRPEVELQKALSASNLSADDLVVDLLRDTVNKSRVARMAACRTKYLSNVVAMLDRLGVRPFRTEPAPCALARLAESQHRAPRRSKGVLRVLLGTNHGLAVMVTGGLPLAWKSFAMTTGMESFAILSAVRGLVTQQTHFGVELPLDYVIIHGRSDLHQQLQQEQLPSDIGTRVIWHEGPVCDSAAVAQGLAFGCLATEAKAFDLSRSIKSRAPIKEIFPWKEAAFAATLMVGMGLALGAQGMKLEETVVSLKAQNSQHICLSAGDPAKLEKERKAMEDKITAARAFTVSRTPWTAYTYDISKRLPPKATLRSFVGKNPLAYGGKKKAAPGFFQLRGAAPLSEDGAIPSEIDRFLREIPTDSLWKRHFASVATEIKLPLSAKVESPEVDFTITGQCKEVK